MLEGTLVDRKMAGNNMADRKTAAGRQPGFTLVELMIAVAIVAIITAIALPAYQDQVRRTKRSDGKGFLLEVAAAQERFFTQNVRYGTLAELGYADSESAEGYYTIAVAREDDNTTYTLTATPRAPFADDQCGNLRLTNTGVQDSTEGDAEDCWD